MILLNALLSQTKTSSRVRIQKVPQRPEGEQESSIETTRRAGEAQKRGRTEEVGGKEGGLEDSIADAAVANDLIGIVLRTYIFIENCN